MTTFGLLELLSAANKDTRKTSLIHGVEAIAVLRVGGDALDPGLDLGRDLGEHVGVTVHAVHANGRVSANAFQLQNVVT